MTGAQVIGAKRYVTGHDENGNAIVVAENQIVTVSPSGNGTKFGVLYETSESPTEDNNGWKDPTDEPITYLANEGGSVLRVTDFPPHDGPVDHRTLSLDYGIVHSGEIVCHLENGEKIYAKSGDVVVQRGTIHGWENVSDEWCRMYFVLLAAKPVTVNGVELPSTGFSKEDLTVGES